MSSARKNQGDQAVKLTISLLQELIGAVFGLAEELAKDMDGVLQKLRSRQRLLDIGCGWGGLVIHAARHYGVDATGITLGQPQAELASERIAEAGLSNRCRVWVRDYREVDEPTYRVWRLFMAGSVYGFSTGRLNVYQSLLVRPDESGQSGLPLTRKDWYDDGGSPWASD